MLENFDACLHFLKHHVRQPYESNQEDNSRPFPELINSSHNTLFNTERGEANLSESISTHTHVYTYTCTLNVNRFHRRTVEPCMKYLDI